MTHRWLFLNIYIWLCVSVENISAVCHPWLASEVEQEELVSSVEEGSDGVCERAKNSILHSVMCS